MRIVHGMLSAGGGGIETSFVAWTHALRQLGHEVTCIVAPRASILSELPGGIALRELPQWFDSDPLAVWRARRLLASAAADLVITHGNRAGRLLAQAHRGQLRHLCVLHRPRFRGLSAFDALACVSRDLTDQLAASGMPRHKLHHVPNFVARLPAPIRTPSPTQKNGAVIGVLARLVPEKGVDLFVEAMRGLPTARAVIAGDGPERAAIEAAIRRHGLQDRIRMAGWIGDTDAFFREVDILCVPSRSESFGIVILESWTHGVPVVATRTSGPSEVVTCGQNGVLCDVSAEGIRAGLLRMIADGSLAASLGAAGREAVAAYDIEAVLPRIAAFCAGRLSAPAGDANVV